MALESSRTLRFVLGGVFALLAASLWLLRDDSTFEAAAPERDRVVQSSIDGPRALDRATERDEAASARKPIDLVDGFALEVALRGGCVVTVLDEHGQPAVDASLWIENESVDDVELARAAAEHPSNVEQLAHAVGVEAPLDADGRATIPVPKRALRVAARAEGLAGWSVIARGEAECVVRLEPSHDIAIRVRGESGQPLRGVDVVLGHRNQWFVELSASEFESRELDMTPVFTTPTDEDGIAWLRDVESFVDPRIDVWWVAAPLAGASPDRYELQLDDLPQSELLFDVGATGSINFELRGPKGSLQRVSGFVRLEPLPSVSSDRVNFRLQSGVARALVDGRAVFQRVELNRAFRAELDVWIDGARQITVEPLTRSGEMRTAAFIDSR